MSSSTRANTNPHRTRPKETGFLVGVRLQPDLLSALDGWIAGQDEQRSRPDAIRYALRDWLIGQGALRFREDPEKAT